MVCLLSVMGAIRICAVFPDVVMFAVDQDVENKREHRQCNRGDKFNE